MIPSGNDAEILYGIPSQSPHVLSAIAGITFGIAVALAILRAIGGRFPIVICVRCLHFALATSHHYRGCTFT